MSRACEQFSCKTAATDWGSATLGRPRGRGFIKNLNDVVLNDTDVVCNGSGQVVAALVEDARMLGRINLGRREGRVRGPGERGGEVGRGSSPPLIKPLRLVAVKDDEGRIRMKPQGSVDDPPNNEENGLDDKKMEASKNGSGEEGSGNRNARKGCNTANDATAMRGITMKDGGKVGGLEQNSTKGAELKGAELNIKKGAELKCKKGVVSEMMSTQAGYTIKRTGLKLGLEKKVETCFLCGQPSEDQVKRNCLPLLEPVNFWRVANSYLYHRKETLMSLCPWKYAIPFTKKGMGQRLFGESLKIHQFC